MAPHCTLINQFLFLINKMKQWGQHDLQDTVIGELEEKTKAKISSNFSFFFQVIFLTFQKLLSIVIVKFICLILLPETSPQNLMTQDKKNYYFSRFCRLAEHFLCWFHYLSHAVELSGELTELEGPRSTCVQLVLAVYWLLEYFSPLNAVQLLILQQASQPSHSYMAFSGQCSKR